MENQNSIQEELIKAKRVSKKNTGGNKISFSALMVVGDKNGSVGYYLGKAPTMTNAIQKASQKAKENMVSVNLVNGTLPHDVVIKRGSAKILVRPAPVGSGLIAGGAVRKVLELAGVKDASAKILGTRNKALNVKATIELLKSL